MSKDTKELAFPRPYTDYQPGSDGKTLRDYFAGQALIGEVSAQSNADGWINTDEAKRDTAKKCYELADAMLEARK